MSGAASRDRGHQFERDIAGWLREHVDPRFVTARSMTGGLQVGGDILINDEGVPLHWVTRDHEALAIEAKNHKAIDLAGWIDQADQVRDTLPLLVVKRRNKPIEASYVVSMLRDFPRLLP